MNISRTDDQQSNRAKQHSKATHNIKNKYKPTIVELPKYSRGETEHSELSGTTNPKAQIKAIREKTEDTRVSTYPHTNGKSQSYNRI